MNLYKKLPIILISLILIGCATREYSINTTYGGLGKSIYKPNASYVQWNKDYAVTAAHFVSPDHVPDYKSEYIDVQFIKKKSENIPVWTDFKPLEKVSMIGFPSIYKNEKIIKGYIAGQQAVFMGSGVYELVTGKIQEGMSGGPVFNENDEVVGINIGYTIEPVSVNNNKEIHSLFLPYSEIQREWDIFQKTKKTL